MEPLKKAKAPPTDDELAVEGGTLQGAKDWTGCTESEATTLMLLWAR